MLCRNVIGTLLVACIIILRVRALPNGLQKSIGKSGTVFEALTLQKGNVYETGPNDWNNYAVLPSNTRVRTGIAPGSPGHQGVSNAWLDELLDQIQANHNQKPDSGRDIYVGPLTYQVNNTCFDKSQDLYGSQAVYKDGKIDINGINGNIYFGANTIQEGNHYIPCPNQQTPNNSFTHGARMNSTESQADPHKLNEDKKISSGSGTIQEESKLIPLPNQQTPNNSTNSTERQAEPQMLTNTNGQSKLSYNHVSTLILSSIGLSMHYIFK